MPSSAPTKSRAVLAPHELAALRDLPIFPLPQAVLFPGARMPLHVFEPRYRQMTRDALDTHRMIAIAHVVEPVRLDAGGRPAIAEIAGVGAIVECRPLPDGRFDVVLEGRARARLEELPFVPPYRRAAAVPLEDTRGEVGPGDHASLLAVANAFIAYIQARDEGFQLTLPATLSPGRVADLCAHHLVLDAQARQRLLETLDAGERVRRVADALAEQLALFKRETLGALN